MVITCDGSCTTLLESNHVSNDIDQRETAAQEHYEAVLVSGQTVESCLHLSLKEHLNAEVSLGTITDVSMAVAWLKTTFLFVRALRQPDRYGIRLPPSRGHDDVLLCRSKVEQYLYGRPFA